MATTNVSLKLLIDTKGQRVLFAEAGKDFVDFLFNILSLPVGTVTRLLTKQDMVGCLGNLYESIENLSDTYFQPTTNKDTLLKPQVSSYEANVPLLLPNIQSSKIGNFYRCPNVGCYGNCRDYIATDATFICPSCNGVMKNPATLVNAPPNKASSSTAANDQGGYVKGVVTYMIMDDLVVSPMSTISSISMLQKFNVQEVGTLQEKLISNVGMNEGVELLKASLQSKTVLTDVFLNQNVGKKPSK